MLILLNHFFPSTFLHNSLKTIKLGMQEKKMLELLQDGVQGEWIMVLKVTDKGILDQLGVETLHIGRIISSRVEVPVFPEELGPIIWYRVFSVEDCSPVR